MQSQLKIMTIREFGHSVESQLIKGMKMKSRKGSSGVANRKTANHFMIQNVSQQIGSVNPSAIWATAETPRSALTIWTDIDNFLNRSSQIPAICFWQSRGPPISDGREFRGMWGSITFRASFGQTQLNHHEWRLAHFIIISGLSA
jgi:hypothetical protein